MAGPEEVLALHLIDLAVLVDHAARPERQNQFITLADAGERRLAALHAAERREHLAVRIRRLVLAVVHPCVRRLGGGFLQRERQLTKRFAVERRLDRDRARLSRLADDELVAIDGHAGIRAVQRNRHVRRRRLCPFWHRLVVRLKEVLHNDREHLVFRRAVGDIDRRDRPAGEFIAFHIAQHDRRARRLRVLALNQEFQRICLNIGFLAIRADHAKLDLAPDVLFQFLRIIQRIRGPLAGRCIVIEMDRRISRICVPRLIGERCRMVGRVVKRDQRYKRIAIHDLAVLVKHIGVNRRTVMLCTAIIYRSFRRVLRKVRVKIRLCLILAVVG